MHDLLDGIFKPISDEKSLHQQLGQISWYSSVQSPSTFRYRLAHKPFYIFRFKIIEQGQLSYPKICPYYFSYSKDKSRYKNPKQTLLSKRSKTRVWFVQRKINESKDPRHSIWSIISHSTSITSIKSHLKRIGHSIVQKVNSRLG